MQDGDNFTPILCNPKKHRHSLGNERRMRHLTLFKLARTNPVRNNPTLFFKHSAIVQYWMQQRPGNLCTSQCFDGARLQLCGKRNQVSASFTAYP
jgi:hypothetical protein